MPTLKVVKADILALGSDLHVDTSTPDFFFFRGEERQMPFATIVTRDTEYDSFSKLDDGGRFRLNTSLDRGTFADMFPDYTSRAALEAASFDYAARDKMLPHPVYGRMHWVCVVNPDLSYAQCRVLLGKAYESARR